MENTNVVADFVRPWEIEVEQILLHVPNTSNDSRSKGVINYRPLPTQTHNGAKPCRKKA
jgi:hypothetical protein